MLLVVRWLGEEGYQSTRNNQQPNNLILRAPAANLATRPSRPYVPLVLVPNDSDTPAVFDTQGFDKYKSVQVCGCPGAPCGEIERDRPAAFTSH